MMEGIAGAPKDPRLETESSNMHEPKYNLFFLVGFAVALALARSLEEK